ncbi:hypothetical protein [Halosegnis sp.]|uniref:hypothetical protein n=1 Tax=Halosegnis sp. TaxID=2864959 RepID=UPI0035D4E5D4
MYDSGEALEDRIATLLRGALMPGEEFVAAARCTDGLVDRWATRLVVTTHRVLAIRKVLFESSVRGVKLSRLNDVTVQGPSIRLIHGLETDEYELTSESDATAVADAIERAGEATVPQ